MLHQPVECYLFHYDLLACYPGDKIVLVVETDFQVGTRSWKQTLNDGQLHIRYGMWKGQSRYFSNSRWFLIWVEPLFFLWITSFKVRVTTKSSWFIFPLKFDKHKATEVTVFLYSCWWIVLVYMVRSVDK